MTNLRRGSVFLATIAGLVLVSGPVLARNDLDVTMRLVDQNEEITDSVTREIRLPELPALQQRPQPRGNSERPGQVVRDQVREKGRDFGQSMAERAREARESRPQRPTPDNRPVIEPGKKPELPPQSSRP